MKTSDWYEHKNFLNRGRDIGVPIVAYYNTGDKKWLKFCRDDLLRLDRREPQADGDERRGLPDLAHARFAPRAPAGW